MSRENHLQFKMVLDTVNIKIQNKNGHATWTKLLLEDGQISTWDKRNTPAKYVYIHTRR